MARTEDLSDAPVAAKRRPDTVDAKIGIRIRLQRQALNLSQFALAEKLDISFQQIQKYEGGKNRVSASMLVRLADALECSPALLLLGYEHQPEIGDLQWLLMLSQAGARDLLSAFCQIPDPETRAAVIAVARGLAAPESRETGCG